MESRNWRAGNIARSRLSGGSGRIRTRPPKSVWRGRQTSLHRILLNIGPNTIKLRTGSDQTIEAFLLPKRSMGAEEKIGLVSGESFQRSQPFCGEHVRGRQKMHVIRHDDERMELIPPQLAVSMPQRCHYLRNLRSPQEQRTTYARVQEPVDRNEGFARREESGWWEYPISGETAMQPERDEQGLIDYVPMGQPPLIMPHTTSLCLGGAETLTVSRLKAGCGQYCPPSI